MKQLSIFLSTLLVAVAMVSPVLGANVIRIGHFPNLTHAQPLVGRALGTYEKKIGGTVDWKVFNAGPSEMEALLAGQLDIAYVGPNPALNVYLRSKGKALKIVAGASSGGAAFVVPRDSAARRAGDFRGRKVAAPELGNTQDVALRYWLKSNGLSAGKDVKVMSIKNPDILMLFQQKQVDGAWVPEPWVTRLVREGGGRILFDERSLWDGGKFPTAVVVVREEFLRKNPEVVRRFLEAHVELTEYIRKHPEEAKKKLNEQLARLAGKPLPPQVLQEAFTRVLITYDPLMGPLVTCGQRAQQLGYLPRQRDVAKEAGSISDLGLLNDVLRKRGLPPVRER